MSNTEPTVTELTIIETIEIHPPEPEQQEAPEPEQPEATREHYLCRHIFVDGHQCGSRSLRGQHFCYYHHAYRTPMPTHQRRRQPRSGFDLTRLDGLDNHAAIQLSLSEVLGRIANDSIDPKRAWLLLYGLQIAGHNLRRARPNPEAAVPDTIVEDPHHGHMAETEPGRTVPPNFYDQFRAELDKNPKADPGKLTDQLMEQFADQRPIADLPIPKVQAQPLQTETLGQKDRGVGGAHSPATNPPPAPTTQSDFLPDRGFWQSGHSDTSLDPPSPQYPPQ